MKLAFNCDYLEGAHEKILKRLIDTNREKTVGYGDDPYCAMAAEKIRAACGRPKAKVYFFVGGTPANATIIDGILRNYQGVISADTGHINGHEAGAIETAGHKVLALPHKDGKLRREDVESYLKDFYGNNTYPHMVQPGMVYISQPTENGTLYTLEELTALSRVCKKHNLPLYADGARLAYGLATQGNDVTLKDLAELCDAFYIGGTKCGRLFGEAAVITNPDILPCFFTTMKQHGAVLAKGRLLGLQFDEMFTDDLYLHIGESAIKYADEITGRLVKFGYHIYMQSPTNQRFTVMDNETLKKFGEEIEYGYWRKVDENHTAIRLATSWRTTREDVDRLIRVLEKYKPL